MGCVPIINQSEQPASLYDTTWHGTYVGQFSEYEMALGQLSECPRELDCKVFQTIFCLFGWILDSRREDFLQHYPLTQRYAAGVGEVAPQVSLVHVQLLTQRKYSTETTYICFSSFNECFRQFMPLAVWS